nr:non-structural maintenance of chromosomes element 3 homolog [Penaeus vannamei]
MAEANRIMERVYGYKVVELEKKNQFIMINTLMMNNQDDDDLLLAPTSNSEVANIGLVTAILAGIFMSGQVMQEGPMREYLKKLGIDIELPRRAPYLWQRHKIYSSIFSYIVTIQVPAVY